MSQSNLEIILLVYLVVFQKVAADILVIIKRLILNTLTLTPLFTLS